MRVVLLKQKLRIFMVEWEVCSAITDTSTVLVCVYSYQKYEYYKSPLEETRCRY
jgi:hypothetical protein